jgi:hypothetical protein
MAPAADDDDDDFVLCGRNSENNRMERYGATKSSNVLD